MAKEEAVELLSIDGREVRVTHPGKLYFSKQVQLTKLDLVRYYLAVAPGALAGIHDRPLVLKRFVNGAEGEAFYQKRAPTDRPAWLRTVTLSFPSGRTAEELVIDDAASLAWIVNLGSLELHPHAIRSGNLDHPDELRVDLDPSPGVGWADVRTVALEVRLLLTELGLQGWPKTSGSRGMHVNVRIHPHWTFSEVRRAALALSRAIERRAPVLASSKWWKEERHGVFLDYNQNAKDRTTCSAYSIRPLPDARVSTPLRWEEVPDCEPADFTVLTVPARFAEIDDPHARMDDAPGSLDKLLELAAQDEAAGIGDAPWPPHFRKMEGEAPRVAPSRAKSSAAKARPKRAPTKKPVAPISASITVPDPATVDSITMPGAPRLDSETWVSTSASSPAPKKQRRSKMPLITIANSPSKEAALAGLERWKTDHPEAAALLAIDDVLVDSMRGKSSTWTRIRLNLRHIPEEQRPPQEAPAPDDDPTREWRNS